MGPTGVPLHMMLVRSLPIVLLLVACGGLVPTPRGSGVATLRVQPAAMADGPGISIAAAIADPGQPVLVNGSLLVEPDGTAWLCEALGESFPPSCSGARLRVDNLDAAAGLPRLASGGGATWSDGEVQLLGTVTVT